MAAVILQAPLGNLQKPANPKTGDAAVRFLLLRVNGQAVGQQCAFPCQYIENRGIAGLAVDVGKIAIRQRVVVVVISGRGDAVFERVFSAAL